MAGSVGKRVKITRMQQHMMLAVLGASLVFGVTLVLSIYFVKYISFNSKVISGKETATGNYDTAIKNAGICIDSNNDGKFTNRELEDCDPNAIDIATIPGTLRYNVMVGLATNTDLESVARGQLMADCYTPEGDKINFTEMYRKAQSEKERSEFLEKLTQCSSLRVIPDALPSYRNEEALLASLNEIFIISGFEPEGLSPAGGSAVSRVKGLSAIPVNLSIEADSVLTHRVLANIERSIREFDIQAATITWGGEDEFGNARLELRTQADAYYMQQKVATEETVPVDASADAKKKRQSGSSN